MRRTSLAATLACALLAGGAPIEAAAQTAFAPAVVVNDDAVTYYDIEQRARLLQLNGAAAGPQLSAAAAEQLIDDRLRAQAGKRFDLVADEEERAAGAEEFAQRLGVDRATLIDRMAKLGVEPATLDAFVSAQIVWRELVNGRFGARATPTEVELDQEIQLAASGQVRSYRLSEIAVPARPGQEAAAEAEINRILEALQRGESFDAVARRFSRAASAREGGDVGWVPESVLPPDLGRIIAATPPGGVTPPYLAPGGIAIYRVAETREEAPPFAREAEVELRRIAVPVAGSGEDATAAAVAEAERIREETEGCGSIPDLSGRATMESIDRKVVSALPGPVRDAVRLLQAGQASRPLRGDGSVELFVVCSRSGGVDEETRARLREQIRTQRLARLAEGYLQDLRREAVIERR